MKKIKLWMMALLCAVLLLPAFGVKAESDRIDTVSVSDVGLLDRKDGLNRDHIGLPDGAPYHVVQVDWFDIEDGKVNLNSMMYSDVAGSTFYVMIMLEAQDKEVFGDEDHVLSSCTVDGTEIPKLTPEQIAGLEEEGICADGYYYNYGESGQYNIISLCMSVTVQDPPRAPFDTSTKPVLLLQASTYGKRAVKLKWNKVDGAKSYEIYGCACGSKCRKLVTVKKCSYIVKKIKKKKLTSHKVYKFYVVAKKGKKKLLTSKTAHIITAKTKGKYANAVSIKAESTSEHVGVGRNITIKAAVKTYKGKKHLGKGHGEKLRYISANPDIASVDQKGKVTAKKRGWTKIYIQDTSGIYCEVDIYVGV